jgi:hypothetical protein
MTTRESKRFGPSVRRPNLGSNAAPKKPKPAAARAAVVPTKPLVAGKPRTAPAEARAAVTVPTASVAKGFAFRLLSLLRPLRAGEGELMANLIPVIQNRWEGRPCSRRW